MPYIKKKERAKLDYLVKEIAEKIYDEGALNYVISSLCFEVLQREKINYKTLNAIIGVLTCVLQEFYRRIVVPYENSKIEENGDIFN